MQLVDLGRGAAHTPHTHSDTAEQLRLRLRLRPRSTYYMRAAVIHGPRGGVGLVR